MTKPAHREAIGATIIFIRYLALVIVEILLFFIVAVMTVEKIIAPRGLASNSIDVRQRSSQDVSLSIHSPNGGVFAG